MEEYLTCEGGDCPPVELMVPIAGARYRDAINRSLQWFSRPDEGTHWENTQLPNAVEQINKASAARLERLKKLLAQNQSPIGSAPDAGSGPAHVDGGMASLPVVWTEKPLPSGVAAYQEDRSQKGFHPRPKLPVPLPQGYWPVRLERIGAEMVALADSQSVDPTGEVSGGGYWLFISKDGKHWGPAIYTGLRIYRPYVVVPKSRLPILSADGQRVQVEVEIRELDEEKIVFPPICMATKRTRTGLFLEAPIATLERDTDGDGLSDLLEERLMLNPNNRDSDGDGIADGADAMPNVSDADQPSPDAAILKAFFELGEYAPPGIMTGGLTAPGDASIPMYDVALRPTDKVLFVEAGGLDFHGLKPNRRIVVLQPDQMEEAVKRFGHFYPLSFGDVLRSADGKKVFFKYTEHWRGGAIHAEFKGGVWVLTSLGRWVT